MTERKLHDGALDGAAPSVGAFSESLPAPSGVRRQLDADNLERLLALSLELPMDQGLDGVARFVLDRLHPLMPSLALGVCIARPGAEQIVETRVPAGVSPRSCDPTRLFSDLEHEVVFSLGAGLTGSTLHVASNDPRLLEQDQSEIQLLARAVAVLESGFASARTLEEAVQGSQDLRRLQAQLIQSEKLASLGQIVAGVVHELNNPLTSIIAYSDYLKRRAESNGADDELERLRRISDAAERILRFSRDLVAYSRPASDVPGPVWVEDVIEKALVFCEHEFDKIGVKVEREWQSGLPPVRGVRGQLTQVFVNLFTNAAHAMSEVGGALVVRTRAGCEPDWVCIEVADQGVGIVPDQVDRIFEPFFTTKTEGRGTGLGLSIVRDIVSAHGGGLEVTSEPGAGTTFVVTLPAAAKPASSRPPPR